jgi:hypothetical protein
MRLATIQEALVAAVTGTGSPNRAMPGTVRAARCVPSDKRLAVYRKNVKGAHLQALDQAFPVTREVLGKRYWRQLLEAELPLFGSRSPDLNRYGDFMPSIVGEAQKCRPELCDLPYLGELAILEWNVHCARIAADDPAFDWEGFAALPDAAQAKTRLQLSSALTSLRLEYPVDHIWRVHTLADAVEDQHAKDIVCCVHKQAKFDIGVTRVDSEESALLGALPQTAVGELYNGRAVTGAGDNTAQRIFEWIQRGWIVGFETG